MSKEGKKSRLEPASNVLQSLLQNSKSPLSQQFTRWRLWRYWGEVVGPSLAQHTAPVAYERGRLIVWVSSSARLQELTFVVKALQDKVNEFVGRRWVTHIRFTLDRKSVPRESEVSEATRDFLGRENDPAEG